MYDHPALHKMKENRDIRLLCVDVSNNLGFSCKCCKRTIDGILNFLLSCLLYFTYMYLLFILIGMLIIRTIAGKLVHVLLFV